MQKQRRRERRIVYLASAGLFAGMAVFLAIIDGYLLVSMIVVCAYSFGVGVWQALRSIHRDVLPRTRRLEALLKELDG